MSHYHENSKSFNKKEIKLKNDIKSANLKNNVWQSLKHLL